MATVKEVVAGVSLVQFAAVNAALLEGFRLRTVLALEEIEADRWAQADSGWTEELAGDPAHLARYEAELAHAQACLLAAGKAKLVRSGTGAVATPAEEPAPPPPPTFLAQQPIEVAPPPPAPVPEEPPPEFPAPPPEPQPGRSSRVITRIGAEAPSVVLPFRAVSPAPAPRTPPRTLPAITLPSAPVLPFKSSPPPPADPPPMPLERHASICLEIALDPPRTAEVLARYKITAEEKARADAYYRTQIAADRDLGARWNQAYAAYHAWFTANARPRS